MNSYSKPTIVVTPTTTIILEATAIQEDGDDVNNEIAEEGAGDSVSEGGVDSKGTGGSVNCKTSEGADVVAILGAKLGAKLGKSLGISDSGTMLGSIVKTTVSLPTSSRTRLLHGHQKLLGKNAPPAASKFSSTNSTLASQTCREDENKRTVGGVRIFFHFSTSQSRV